ncbi:tetratricopeptide repeat protein [Ostertagia ostertagi]
MSESTEDLKHDGNRFFQQGRYQEAIDAYSKAIIRNPHVSTYFTNRALCYMNLKAWSKAAEDCSKAAFLDRNNVKAYYFGGRAAIQLGNYNEAIRLITKAKELASSQKMNFGDEIHAQMRLARREKFRVEEEKRVKEEGELQIYLRNAEGEGTHNEEVTDKVEQITQEGEQHKAQLDSLFAQIDDRRRKREIPDFLCGKISCSLLQDPVITPSGITYDRADIKQHLHRVGKFRHLSIKSSPISLCRNAYLGLISEAMIVNWTLSPVPFDNYAVVIRFYWHRYLRSTEADLIPNLAMKEVLEHFLIENPWAKYEDLLS